MECWQRYIEATGYVTTEQLMRASNDYYIYGTIDYACLLAVNTAWKNNTYFPELDCIFAYVSDDGYVTLANAQKVNYDYFVGESITKKCYADVNSGYNSHRQFFSGKAMLDQVKYNSTGGIDWYVTITGGSVKGLFMTVDDVLRYQTGRVLADPGIPYSVMISDGNQYSGKKSIMCCVSEM